MTKKKPNKYLGIVLGIIVSIGIISIGYIVERFLAQSIYPIFIIVPFIFVGFGVFSKSDWSWPSAAFGAGMITYLVSSVVGTAI